jgi:hypothetical protein
MLITKTQGDDMGKVGIGTILLVFALVCFCIEGFWHKSLTAAGLAFLTAAILFAGVPL